MTPYAVLLVRPSDADITIQHAFHSLSKRYHPDKFIDGVVPETAKTAWYEANTAYGAIKTEELRTKFERQLKTLSGVCTRCDGFGVRGSRLGKAKIIVCDSCMGEGRTK